ncbi:MAG: lysozyme family protein [Ethanoligenens sp.]
MVTSAQRETREDAATQDAGVQAARANGGAINLAAQNVRRMTRQLRTRQYEKAAEKTAKGAASAARGIKGLAQKVRCFFQAVFKGSRIGLIVLSAIAVLLVVIIVTMSVLSLLFSGAAAGVNGATMPASDAALDQAEAYYCAKENALRTEIENAQQSHPGYNEYQYQIGGIGHNPVALVAYLSAMYGNFTFDSVESALDDLFNEQYQMSYPTVSQIRTQTVTVTDPTTGQTTTQQQQYTYTILTVKLLSQDFTSLVTPILQRAGKLDVYTVYLQNHGNRMYFSNPFAFAWDVYMTLQSDNSAYVDVPEGTDIKASLSGTVTQASDGTIVITGADGLSVTYWNCININVSTGQSVDDGAVIAQAGSVLKILFVHNSEHLNPYIFSDTGASSDNSGSSSSTPGGQPISSSVEAYLSIITQLAAQYGLSDYVPLILADIEQESDGQGGDPMQSSEGPFNTRYPNCPNGITDPIYSIQCGIQEMHQCLQLAGCTGPTDIAGISLGLQGLNFGSGFISWAQSRGGYSLANAQAFAQMEAAKLGWSSYGDPYYVPHVLRYYSYATGSSSSGGSGAAANVLNYAANYLGYPYVFGTAGPDTFDCSGFVQWVYSHVGGISLPRTAAEQSGVGSAVDEADLQPGDLVFFNVDGNGIDHVGIYVGGGRMINAENPRAGIIYDNILSGYWADRFACARKVL